MTGKALFLATWLGLFFSPLWALGADGGDLASGAVLPDAPSVTIVEYTDFQCPFCARVQPVRQRLMDEYPGRVQWEIKHFPLDFHADSMLAHQAALAAGEQGRFWEMHDLLFANRHALKQDQLLAYAQRLGLDKTRFLADQESPKIHNHIAADLEEGHRLGVRGTPTFFINGKKLVGAKSYATFKSYIDAALGIQPAAGAGSPLEKSSQTVIQKVEATPPTVGDAPVLGVVDAPVTIIAFSDFQCPYCRKVQPVLQALQDRYPGKIRLAFKHFPLGFHKQSPDLHRAALAAGRQGRFWEMHDALFALRYPPAKEELLRMAVDMGLDGSQFLADLKAPSVERRLQGDIAEGRAAGVTGTPTFFINGEKLVGAQPVDIFSTRIDRQLEAIDVAHDEAKDSLEELAPSMSVGSMDAPVKLSLFADIGSPLSATAAWRIKTLLRQYPGKVQFKLRHFPMPYRPGSALLHRAVLAAADQGKGWEMLDLLFALGGTVGSADLVGIARSLGLNSTQFADALDSERIARRLRKDRRQGARLGVRGVPTLFINDEKFDGLPNARRLKEIMERTSATDRVAAGLSQGGKS